MKSHKLSCIASISFLVLGVVACDDANDEPSDDNVIITDDAGLTAGNGGTGGTGGGQGGTGGDDDDGGVAAGSGGAGGQGGTGGGAGLDVEPERADCPSDPNSKNDDDEDCWDVSSCNGKKSEQFLQQCSDTCIAPFDNATRIEGYTATLPPLT